MENSKHWYAALKLIFPWNDCNGEMSKRKKMENKKKCFKFLQFSTSSGDRLQIRPSLMRLQRWIHFFLVLKISSFQSSIFFFACTSEILGRLSQLFRVKWITWRRHTIWSESHSTASMSNIKSKTNSSQRRKFFFCWRQSHFKSTTACSTNDWTWDGWKRDARSNKIKVKKKSDWSIYGWFEMEFRFLLRLAMCFDN